MSIYDRMETGVGNRPFIKAIRDRLASQKFDHFDVRPQAPCLGAEVLGLDLRETLSDEVVTDLRRALAEFKVLFFRAQQIDSRQQAAFASRFGELEEHPFLPSNTAQPEVIRFEKDENVVGTENLWHSDVTWREIPSLGSVLRAVEVPPIGGDTLWCDMEAAYEGLDEATKAAIEGRFAIHDFMQSFGYGLSPEEREKRRREFPEARHPIVRTHPETGRRCIYVNGIFTREIEGVSQDESDRLMRKLTAQARIPELQVRFRWQPGDIAFWDNRSTQHYASNDYWPERRVMERVTIIGDRPV